MGNKSNKILKGENPYLYVNGQLIGQVEKVSIGVDMSNENDKTVLTKSTFVEGQQVFQSKTIQLVTDLIKTESSNVDLIAFNTDTKQAFVGFKNGTLYQYDEVEREEFEKLRDSQSVGKYLSGTFLKKGYKYKKLQDTELSHGVLTSEAIENAFKVSEELNK